MRLFPINREALKRQDRYAALFEHALAARALLENVWSDETAYQGIILQPDDVSSRGQCGVSSVWLSRHLLTQGFDAMFTEGKIYLLDEENGDDHVWVEVRNATDKPLVVDITSDQYKTALGTSVHVGVYADETTVVGRYTPEQYFHPHDIPRRKLMGRYAVLETAIKNRS